MKGTSLRITFLGFFAIALVFSGAVSCGGSDDPTPPPPDPVASAPGNYFVTQFLATNTANSQDVIDAEAFGLSLYFVLNANGTLVGTVQTPSNPPGTTSLTGDWELEDGVLTIVFTDPDGNSRTLTGSLGFDADGDVVFDGAQTGGAPIQFDGDGPSYNISSFGMHQYAEPVTAADFAGQWVADTATAISNDDGSITKNLIPTGGSVTMNFGADGSFQVQIVNPGGDNDNITGTFTVVDDFHIAVVVENETTSIVYGLVDGQLTLFNYNNKDDFNDPDVSDSATQVFQLHQI